MLFSRKVKNRLASVEHLLNDYQLPSFPGVIADALGRLSDPEVAMVDVARVLELDPGLSVKLLRLASSPAIGLRNPVENLQHAIMILGRNQVESVLISAAATASIPRPKSPVFDIGRFWRAAACRAVVASQVCGLIDPPRRSEAFTAALLKDMALPILVDHVDGYDRVLKQWYDCDITDLAEAEIEVFGWDHASVAAKMATIWEFPETLLNAITFHHDLEEPPDIVAVRLVAGWHEVDEAIGRAFLVEQAAVYPELDGFDLEAVVDRALDGGGDVTALFS